MGLCNNRIVVKVGTSTLTNDAGKSDLRAIDRLVCTLADKTVVYNTAGDGI